MSEEDDSLVEFRLLNRTKVQVVVFDAEIEGFIEAGAGKETGGAEAF